jgi:hypothetical protein
MRIAALVVLGLLLADVVVLLLLLGTVWVAHRSLCRAAAAQGETVPSAAADFRCLFVVLLAGLLVLAGASVVVFIV